MNALTFARKPRYSKAIEQQHERYERKVAWAERNEERLLKLVHRSYTVKGTPLDLNLAARIIGEGAHYGGLSFHEELYLFHHTMRRGWSVDFHSRAYIFGARTKEK